MTSQGNIRFVLTESGDVEASDDALTLMAACVNEALEAVGEWEFSIRIGFTTADATALKDQIEAVLQQRDGGPL